MSAETTPVNGRAGGPGTFVALATIVILSLAIRLPLLPLSTPANMDPDAAHFLNVARCFERGQGFSNVGAWPAWMKPERLPMPETFKEPGYSWLIWKLKPVTGGDPFRAGQAVSMVGGLAIPLLLYALARRLTRDRAVGFLTGLLAATSPLLAAQSARVMVDSIFPAFGIAAMLLAACRPERGRGAAGFDAATGIALGIAFMLRGGALSLLLPLGILAFQRRPRLAGLAGFGLVIAAAGLTASPFILRNLRLFGTWFHSDVGAYGIWPYVDQLMFNAGLDRPPAPIAFALTHVPQVLRHWIDSAIRFAGSVWPDQFLSPVWTLPAAAGLLLSLRRARDHAFAYAYLGFTTAFIFAINWDARYLVLSASLACVYAGIGGVWMWRRLGDERVPLAGSMRPVLVLMLLAAIAVQFLSARKWVRGYVNPEGRAAVVLAPEIQRRVPPGDAVMVMTTSTYAWFSDRPTVHFVIASEDAFDETVRRLRVRLAVLPTDRLAEFAGRFADGRLPRVLRFERDEPGLGVSVFTVAEPDPEPAP